MNNSTNWAIFSIKFDGIFNARTNNAGDDRPRRSSRAPWSAARTSTGSSGTRTRSATTSTAPWSPRTSGATSAPPRCARSPATSPRRRRGHGRLDADEPLSRLGHLRLARLRRRRRPDRGLGCAQLELGDAPGTGIAISVRTGNTPTPDGTWSAFTPIPTAAATSRQQPLRPVPGRADEQRPGPDADPERGLDRLRARPGRHPGPRDDDPPPAPASTSNPTPRSSPASTDMGMTRDRSPNPAPRHTAAPPRPRSPGRRPGAAQRTSTTETAAAGPRLRPGKKVQLHRLRPPDRHP